MAFCLALCAVPTARAENSGKQADAAAFDSYTTALGSDTSTRYNGRVWSDKTVSGDSIHLSGVVDGQEQQYTYTVDPDNGEDFLVAFSTLATSVEETHLPKVPVDVVYVLDFSASMTWGSNAQTVVNRDDSRIAALVDALNKSIYQLQMDNAENRIGVVYFNRIGHEWLDLQELGEKFPEDINQDGIPDYFSLESFTGTEEKDDGAATVKCNFGKESGSTAKTDSKTNIQFGLNVGMRMLADAGETTFQSEQGNPYTRIPNVVLMSDGAPTTISLPEDGSSWWGALKENGGESVGWGDNNRPWSANGFMPMITAQYLKEQITRHYKENATQASAKNADQARASFYTIGFGVSQQTEDMVKLANLVLNPAASWNTATNGTTDVLQKIKDQWQAYSGGKDVEVKYAEDSNDSYPEGGESFTVTHSNQWNPPAVPDYVNAYYEANNADQLADAFRQIISEITEAAKSPTEVENNDPVHDGYITYTDPLGKYMAVKGIKALLFAGHAFTEYETSTAGNVTTYTFHGVIESEVYGRQDASQILITVTRNTDGSQTLQVKIPAVAIPLRVNNVVIDEDGKVKENTYNDAAYPLRLIYGVGRVENAELLLACDPDYRAAHGADGDRVYLYSNLYSGNDLGIDGSTAKRGDATVTFQPAENNPFYFLQEDTLLYTDPACTTRAAGTLDPEGTYYFTIRFYAEQADVDGQDDVTLQDGVATATIARKGTALQHEGVVVKSDQAGLYMEKGSPRLGNLSDLAVAKAGDNPVTEAYAFATAAARDDSGDWIMTSYLGNNGRVAVTPAALKTVADENGKDLNGQTVQVGQALTFTIRYGNSGSSVQNITITDTLPAGTEYLTGSADSNGVWSEESRTLTWTIVDVAPGATGTVTFRATVTEDAIQPGQVENSARILLGTNTVTTNTVTVDVQAPTPVPTPSPTTTPSETPDEPDTTTPAVTAAATATPAPTAQPAREEPDSTVHGIPQTGDASHPGLWGGLMGVSALGFAALLFMRKKHF